MHLVDLATRMQRKAIGEAAQIVPFHLKKTKMTLYKGPDALATRRAVAKALTPSLITALQRPRRADDKPDWAPMQQLFDAGFKSDPVSGLPVFDPSACTPALLESVWQRQALVETNAAARRERVDNLSSEEQQALREITEFVNRRCDINRRVSKYLVDEARRARFIAAARLFDIENVMTGFR